MGNKHSTLGSLLIAAAGRGDELNVRRYLDFEDGLDLTTYQDDDGNNALLAAIRHHRVACVSMLLEAGVNVNVVNAIGMSPLLLAAGSGQTEIVRKLLDWGADPNYQQPRAHGWTALLSAVHKGSSECAQALIDAGADLSIRKHDGKSALHLAAVAGNEDIARMLAPRCSEMTVTAVDLDGKTARELALASNHPAVATYLATFDGAQTVVAKPPASSQPAVVPAPALFGDPGQLMSEDETKRAVSMLFDAPQKPPGGALGPAAAATGLPVAAASPLVAAPAADKPMINWKQFRETRAEKKTQQRVGELEDQLVALQEQLHSARRESAEQLRERDGIIELLRARAGPADEASAETERELAQWEQVQHIESLKGKLDELQAYSAHQSAMFAHIDQISRKRQEEYEDNVQLMEQMIQLQTAQLRRKDGPVPADDLRDREIEALRQRKEGLASELADERGVLAKMQERIALLESKAFDPALLQPPRAQNGHAPAQESDDDRVRQDEELRAREQEHQESIAALEAANAEAQSQIAGLEAQLAGAAAASGEGAAAELGKALEKREATLGRLRDELALAKSTEKRFEKKLRSLESRVAEGKAASDELQAELVRRDQALQAVRDESSNLESSLAATHAAMRKLEDSTEVLLKDRTDLEAQVARADKDLAAAAADLERMTTARDSLAEREAALKEQQQALEQQAKEAQDEITALSEELAQDRNLTEQLSGQRESQMTLLQARLEGLTQAASDKDKAIAQLEEAIGAAEKRTRELESQLNAQRSKGKEKDGKLATLVQKLKDMTASLAEKDQQIKDMRLKMDVIGSNSESRFQDLEDSIESLTADLESKDEALGEAQAKVRESVDEIARLEGRVHDLETASQAREQHAQNAAAESETLVDALQDRIQDLERQMSGAQEASAIAESRAAQLQGEVKTLEEELSKLKAGRKKGGPERQIKQLQVQLIAKERELDGLKAQVEASGDSTEVGNQLRVQLQERDAQLSELKKQHQAERDSEAAQRESLQSQLEERDARVQELTTLQKQLQSGAGRSDELQTLQAQVEEGGARVQELQKQLQEQAAELKSSAGRSDELQALQAQLEERDSEIAQLKERLAAAPANSPSPTAASPSTSVSGLKEMQQMLKERDAHWTAKMDKAKAKAKALWEKERAKVKELQARLEQG